jgi:hypothetical protein
MLDGYRSLMLETRVRYTERSTRFPPFTRDPGFWACKSANPDHPIILSVLFSKMRGGQCRRVLDLPQGKA